MLLTGRIFTAEQNLKHGRRNPSVSLFSSSLNQLKKDFFQKSYNEGKEMSAAGTNLGGIHAAGAYNVVR